MANVLMNRQNQPGSYSSAVGLDGAAAAMVSVFCPLWDCLLCSAADNPDLYTQSQGTAYSNLQCSPDGVIKPCKSERSASFSAS